MAEEQEKTEAATPKRRSKLREQGQVAKSPDLTSMIVLLGMILAIHAASGMVASRITHYLQSTYSSLHMATLTPNTLFQVGGQMMLLLFYVLGPVFMTAMSLGIITNVLQTGLLFSAKALTPDLNRLNPMNGIKRVISSRGAVEALKSIVKLLIIGGIANKTIRDALPTLLVTNRQDIYGALAAVGEIVYRLSLRITLSLLVLSALDYFYQRYSFEKQNRMSKHEVKQEGKESSANPQMRSRMRQRAQQQAKNRMMADIPMADVIITNPTHYAIALQYMPGMGAPKVLGKGMDFVALKIREIAETNNIPIVENPPLARALYKSVEIGREIPSNFFAPVAEILAYVYSLNNRAKAGVR